MHVISKKALEAFCLKHTAFFSSLDAWYRVVRKSDFGTFSELKKAFNTSGYVAVPKTIDKYYTGKTHCGMSSSMTFPEQFWKRFAYRDSAGKVQIAPNGRVSAKGAGLAFA